MTGINFKNFSYEYPNGTLALEAINIDIPKGSFTVITGPSGAGKTSLALAVAGVVPHYFGGRQGGSVTVCGINASKSSMGELAGIVGTVLADYESQLVAMTAAEEVGFGLETAGISRNEATKKISEALSVVGLAGFESCSVAGLSGGQKQRLAIAAVLAMSPDILVLDEPASALDPEGAADIYNLLGELNRQGKTIIVVEHQLARILPYADQVVLMRSGRAELVGSLGETLSYMWKQPGLRQGVPTLWAIKLTLEEAATAEFSSWTSENDAAADINHLINITKEVA